MPNNLEAGVMMPRTDSFSTYKFLYRQNNEKVSYEKKILITKQDFVE